MPVVVDGELVVQDETALWSATADDETLVLIVPESSGCSRLVELSNIDPESMTVDVVALTESEGECAADLFLSPKELRLDTDVRGFTVRVSAQAGSGD